MRGKPNPLVWLVVIAAIVLTGVWERSRTPRVPVTPAPPAESARQTATPAPAKSAEPDTASSLSSRVDDVVRDAHERAQLVLTLERIEKGGPFPWPGKDGTVFSNREGRLPRKERGYYREYTVPTDGAKNRGARRVIRGREGETYYTRDHYETFTRID